MKSNKPTVGATCAHPRKLGQKCPEKGKENRARNRTGVPLGQAFTRWLKSSTGL